MADEATTTTEGNADQAAANEATNVNTEVQTEQVAQTETNTENTSTLVTAPNTEVTELESEVEDGGIVTYQPTGDASLDVALSFIGNLGIQGNDPAVVAAANGNFALLEAKLATMGDKAQGWQQMMALAKDAKARSDKAVGERVAQTDKAILSVVGSAENWSSIKAWAAANATPDEKAAINAMIDGGPIQARAAATTLLQAYTKATGTSITPANPAKDAGGNAPTGTGPLSPRDYTQAVAELHRKLGTRMETSQEYRALQARLAK